MSRPVTLVVAILLSAFSVHASYVGLLGELVEWPIFAGGMPGRPLPLNPEPEEPLVAIPDIACLSSDISYGLIPLGNGPDRGITVLVIAGDSGSQPRVWIDRDNDENLMNEPEIPAVQSGLHLFSWYVTVQVEYSENGSVVLAPYHLVLSARYSYQEHAYEFWYAGYCHRKGLVDLDGSLFPLAVMELTSSGLYNDINNLLFVIDTDGDGELNMLPGSHELYGPGELLQVKEALYRIVSVSPSGRRIVIEEVGTAPPRPIIAPGYPAPDFETVTLDGDLLRLSDLRGAVVILLFEPTLDARGCSDCSSPGEGERLRELVLLLDRLQDVILIVITEQLTSTQFSGMEVSTLKLLFVEDPELVRLYRRRLGLVIVDKSGIIRAMDQAWVAFDNGRPRGRIEQLGSFEVLEIVESLLAE